MDFERLRNELTQDWQAAKARYERAQHASQEATADALRAEGALKMLARLEQEQVSEDVPDPEVA